MNLKTENNKIKNHKALSHRDSTNTILYLQFAMTKKITDKKVKERFKTQQYQEQTNLSW